MKYEKTAEGIFRERPNRFVAYVETGGRVRKVHVPNTGRCGELLLPGAKVILRDFRDDMRNRKTEFSLIAVEKKREKPLSDILVNIDSAAPNKVAEEGLKSGDIILPHMGKLKGIHREKTYGNSRFDFFVEDEKGKAAFVEVKGVTLEKDNVASFPDAPTERGLKHVLELEKAANSGFGAYVLFIIQMEGMKRFVPNDVTHKAFGDALRSCKNVCKIARDCRVSRDELLPGGEVDIIL